jgi:hypothetical protein
MKTKTFFFICLLLGIGVTQLSAQKWPKGSHNIPTFWTYYDVWRIDCDGVTVDKLEGELRYHLSQFVIPGENGGDPTVVWDIAKFSGTLTSIYEPYEVFTVQEVDKANRPLATYTYHGIYKGNQGHSYNVWGHLDYSTWEWVIDKSICH